MSIPRPRYALALASLVLACGAIGGCHKASPPDADDGPASADAPSADGDTEAIARSLNLDASQRSKLSEIEARGGWGGRRHGGGGGWGRGRGIERRVERIARELGLTPDQTEKLRAIFQEMAARFMRRAMQGGGRGFPGGGFGRRGGRGFPQGGPGDGPGPDGPGGGRHGGWHSRRGGGFPQGGPGDDPGDPRGGGHFGRGGRGFPQGGPADDPQGPDGPGYDDDPEGPEGPQDPNEI